MVRNPSHASLAFSVSLPALSPSLVRYPIDRLSTEIALSSGRDPEAPDIVAERARLVFTVMERVCPQFPSI
jgi:hypothetical protein